MHDGADDREHQRDADGLELLEPQRRCRRCSARLVLRFALTSGGGEEAGHERAQRAADAVNAEGVERVVVLEHRLQLGAGEERHDAGEHADDDRARRRDEAGGRA